VKIVSEVEFFVNTFAKMFGISVFSRKCQIFAKVSRKQKFRETKFYPFSLFMKIYIFVSTPIIPNVRLVLKLIDTVYVLPAQIIPEAKALNKWSPLDSSPPKKKNLPCWKCILIYFAFAEISPFNSSPKLLHQIMSPILHECYRKTIGSVKIGYY
jgi:hypothetical protein